MQHKQIKDIIVVGSGNVAESIAYAIAQHPELRLRQIVARNRERGRELSEMLGTEHQPLLQEAAKADLYIIAVSDRAVGEVAQELPTEEDAIVVHTAGSVAMEQIPNPRRGVFYPFQTFTKGRRVDFSKIPLFIEASDESTLLSIELVANTLSQRVYRADSACRKDIHLTGVLACNFVNSLYAMAADFLSERQDLPFDVLRPLIEECAAKAISSHHPRTVQTGPAVRGDKGVCEAHLQLLSKEPQQQKIYKLLTDYIWETSKKI